MVPPAGGSFPVGLNGMVGTPRETCQQPRRQRSTRGIIGLTDQWGCAVSNENEGVPKDQESVEEPFEDLEDLEPEDRQAARVKGGGPRTGVIRDGGTPQT